jgi:L-threonylcarbamoyladenylate synthase
MAHLLTKTATESTFNEAIALLQQGRLVAFPTETVYGLGANACSDSAIKRIYEVKQRPAGNPLISHIYSADQAALYAKLSPLAEQAMLHFWPGPLTLVLPRSENCPISMLCSAGLPTLTLRCPAHPVARELLRRAQMPIAAPSANPSGRISPTCAHHVAQAFADMPMGPDLIIAGGRSAVGLESTVLDLSDPATPHILRPGSILQDELEQALGLRLLVNAPNSISASANMAHKAPGQLSSHYAPTLPVRLDVLDPQPDEIYLAFGPTLNTAAAHCLNLSEQGDLAEAAHNLFDYLHMADQLALAKDGNTPAAVRAIAVAPIPATGIGLALNDRLMRAAAPRS